MVDCIGVPLNDELLNPNDKRMSKHEIRQHIGPCFCHLGFDILSSLEIRLSSFTSYGLPSLPRFQNSRHESEWPNARPAALLHTYRPAQRRLLLGPMDIQSSHLYVSR